ncbi:hypothetical protein [Lacibacter sp. H407]|uniref:hypothetical protein n=1 Tax=Lacibacter sp. H407 TaxID=3133423 RepID=UPI0030C134C7
MQNFIYILITCLILVMWFLWRVYGKILLNREVRISHIGDVDPHSIGNLKYSKDTIEVRFTRNTKLFSLDQIVKIKAYSLTTWGLEQFEQIEINFDNANRIIFDGSLKEHRDFIEVIISKLDISAVTLRWGRLPHLGDKENRDTIFDKEKSNGKPLSF